MFKKTFLIMFSCVWLLFSSSCSQTQTEDSVIIKESNDTSNYRLQETSLIKPVEFKKDGLSVCLNDILYEDLLTWFSFDVKNDTDKPCRISITDLSVNGIMCQKTTEEYVDSKSSRKIYFEINNGWFDTSFIEAIKELEFTVRILDETSTEIAISNSLKALTNAPKNHEQKYNSTGTTVYDSNGVRIIAQGLEKSKFSDDSELGFFIENNANPYFSLLADEVYVNDKLFTPAFVVSVGSNKKASESILFTKAELDAANIDNITSVKVSFKAIDKSSNTVFKTELADIPLK